MAAPLPLVSHLIPVGNWAVENAAITGALGLPAPSMVFTSNVTVVGLNTIEKGCFTEIPTGMILHNLHLIPPMQFGTVVRALCDQAIQRLRLLGHNSYHGDEISIDIKSQVTDPVLAAVPNYYLTYVYPDYDEFINFTDILRTAIQAALNSDEDFEAFEICFNFLSPLPVGGGRGTKRVRTDVPIKCRKKGTGLRSICRMKEVPTDKMCAARALVLLQVYKQRDDDPMTWNRWRKNADSNLDSKSVRQITEAAKGLTRVAALDPQKYIKFTDLDELRLYLAEPFRGEDDDDQECHIQVFDASLAMNLVYSTFQAPEDGNYKNFDKIVWYDLLLENKHYLPILKIHRLLNNQNHYCYRCNSTFKQNHACKMNCSMCQSTTDHYKLYKESKDSTQWTTCDTCHRSFYTTACYDLHIAKEACKRLWKCDQCHKTFFYEKKSSMKGFVNPENHVCGEDFCFNCKSYAPLTHHCYMTPLEPDLTCGSYLFCDFESTQDTGQHIVNLAITQDEKGVQWPIHHNIQDWVAYLLEHGQGCTVIFHNGKGYDFQFIVNELLTGKVRRNVQPIMVGSKILYCTINLKTRYSPKTSIRLVDSLNFLLMPLHSFTKTFGLTAKKGFYPHYFNIPANEDYIGAIPCESMFGVSGFSPQLYAEFKEWYEVRRFTPWNNRKELLDYCIADVKLLREGCLTFREQVMKTTACHHDPFLQPTLASSAMKLFRTDMMEPETIAALDTQMIRDLKPCLAGGRTGCSKMYVLAAEDERLEYIDFTSAYPKINKTGLYPHGHPTLDWNPSLGTPVPSLNEGLSIWWVDVQCPQDLYHPLLHSKDKETGKLYFDLRHKTKVPYTNLELIEACKLGYEITRIYRVIQWKRVIKGIFRKYINFWLKVKQEASGWPANVVTEAEKKAYIIMYAIHEGIQLDPSKIEKNPGLYQLAKMYLNSLWGKFGQRLSEEFTSTKFYHNTTSDALAFTKLRVSKDLKGLILINENCVLATVNGRKQDEHAKVGTGNIALAIFTTAQARLKLYSEILLPLGPRVCYYDTDSAIFLMKKNDTKLIQQLVPLGRFLGDITNELGTDKYHYGSEYIVEYVSGGPKNYAYRTNTDIKMAKIKGHSLHRMDALKLLNFDAIRNSVLHRTAIFVKKNMLVRNSFFEIHNRTNFKAYQPCFTKRKRLPPVYFDNTDIVRTINTNPWLDPDAYEVVASVPHDMLHDYERIDAPSTLYLLLDLETKTYELKTTFDRKDKTILSCITGLDEKEKVKYIELVKTFTPRENQRTTPLKNFLQHLCNFNVNEICAYLFGKDNFTALDEAPMAGNIQYVCIDL